MNDIKLPSKDACECAEIIFSKNLNGEDVLDLIFTMEVSDDNVFGLSMGHLIKTKRWLKNGQLSNSDINFSPSTSTNTITVPKVPRPSVYMDISQIEFDQFIFEWGVYKSHYNISESNVASHLLYSCDAKVRQRLRIDQPDFVQHSYTESELLGIICNIYSFIKN